MKKILLSIFLLCFMATGSNGQNNSFGFNFGLGGGKVLKETLIGGASYELNTGFSVGFNYHRKLSRHLGLMTGLNWYANTVTVLPAFYPGKDMPTGKYPVQLIYIPLLLKLDLGKYFFINGGIIGDIDITNKKVMTNQTGLGASLGIGTEYFVTNKFSIQPNPYLNVHGLLLTNGGKYPARIVDAGIQLSFLLNR